MTPAGVEVLLHDGERVEYLSLDDHRYDYSVEPGWVHVTDMTGEGNHGIWRTLYVESFPSERVRLARHLYRTTYRESGTERIVMTVAPVRTVQ